MYLDDDQPKFFKDIHLASDFSFLALGRDPIVLDEATYLHILKAIVHPTLSADEIIQSVSDYYAASSLRVASNNAL